MAAAPPSVASLLDLRGLVAIVTGAGGERSAPGSRRGCTRPERRSSCTRGVTRASSASA